MKNENEIKKLKKPTLSDSVGTKKVRLFKHKIICSDCKEIFYYQTMRRVPQRIRCDLCTNKINYQAHQAKYKSLGKRPAVKNKKNRWL